MLLSLAHQSESESELNLSIGIDCHGWSSSHGFGEGVLIWRLGIGEVGGRQLGYDSKVDGKCGEDEGVLVGV